MSISELVESEGYKIFMHKLMGIGASVILIGALFKIQHYPGASIALIVGLLTEALIFFLGSFEPIHEELDWTLVYPELAGLDEIEEGMGISKKNTNDGNALQKFDELLEQGKLGPELFQRLGSNLEALNSNVSSLGEISNTAVATDSFVQNVNKAATSAEGLAGAFNSSTAKVSETFDVIAESTKQTAESIIKSGQETSQLISASAQSTANIISTSGNSYQELMTQLNTNFSSIGSSSKEQAIQQEALTKNISALNAVYELQLKNSANNLEETEKITSGINSIMTDLQGTAEDVAKYKTEISKLSHNLATLNTVYGNMLSAMSIK